MKKIDFLIFYEHKNREFESIVLLKCELVRRGYSVEYFSFYDYHDKKKRKALFNNVKIAIMPSLYHNEEILSFVYSVAGRVKNIVNLRWEQIFPIKMENSFDYYVFPKENAKLGYHLCWGRKPFEMLCEAGVEVNKLFITGPIHMDFLREELRGFYLSKEVLFQKYNIDKKRKSVLFTSSFALSSMNKWELEWFYSQLDEDEKTYYQNFIPREIQSRETIIQWLIRLAEEKQCTVIYRPHPAEGKTELIDQIKNYDNIRVISDFNIKQWILTCDQVYTWNSTSIAEASIAGVSCAVLRPVQFQEGEEYTIYQDFPCITDYRQLCKYYESSIIRCEKQMISTEKLNQYIDVDCKIPSYIRTADVLEQALKDGYYFPWNSFSDEELLDRRKRTKKMFRDDFFAKILIKPFYKNRFFERVVSRMFSKQYYSYMKVKENRMRIISDEEFDQFETRIASILDHQPA